MQIEYWSNFLIGFFGGFGHCIGMCGGFVLTYSVQLAQNEPGWQKTIWNRLYPHLLFNAGRVFTYAILGQIFGLLGGTLGFYLNAHRWQGVLQLIAGFIMILLGLDLMGLIPALKPDSFPGLKRFSRMMNTQLHQVRVSNIFLLGMVLGFIPCGLVYAMGARAAATESMLGGMLTMVVFGTGTIFAMVLVGFMAHLISQKQRRWFYRFAAILVIVLGGKTLWDGLQSILK